MQRDRIILADLEQELERPALRVDVIFRQSLEPFDGEARAAEKMREVDGAQPRADEGLAPSPPSFFSRPPGASFTSALLERPVPAFAVGLRQGDPALALAGILARARMARAAALSGALARVHAVALAALTGGSRRRRRPCRRLDRRLPFCAQPAAIASAAKAAAANVVFLSMFLLVNPSKMSVSAGPNDFIQPNRSC